MPTKYYDKNVQRKYFNFFLRIKFFVNTYRGPLKTLALGFVLTDLPVYFPRKNEYEQTSNRSDPKNESV